MESLGQVRSGSGSLSEANAARRESIVMDLAGMHDITNDGLRTVILALAAKLSEWVGHTPELNIHAPKPDAPEAPGSIHDLKRQLIATKQLAQDLQVLTKAIMEI